MPTTSWFRWLQPWRRATEPSWIGPLLAGLTLFLVQLAIFTDSGEYEAGFVQTLVNLALCGYALVIVLEIGGWHLPQPLFLLFAFIPIALAAYVGRDTIVPMLAMVVVWWITYTRSPRQGRTALYCGLVSILPPFLVGRGSLDNFFAWSLSTTLVWVATHALVSQQRTLAELRVAQTHLARQAAADERRRLAREVHDVVAHSLAITLLHVTGARHILMRDPQRAAAALAQAEALGRTSMADLRRTIGLLTTDESNIMAPPSAGDIPALLETFVQAGLSLDYTLTGDLEGVSPGVGLDLYRVLQESLTNVAKHGAGAGASLHLNVDGHAAHIEMTNPLPPMALPSQTGNGRGLLGMNERMATYGGRFSAGPANGVWRVTAWLPLSPQVKAAEDATEAKAQEV